MKAIIPYVFFISLLLYSCTPKEDTPTPDPEPDKNAELNAFLKETLTFKEVKVNPGIFGYFDILFSNNGVAVALNNKNTVYTSYDNGDTWKKRITVTGNTATCIALNPTNNSQLYVGGNSAGNFTAGSTYWRYELPKNGEPALTLQGKTQTNLSEEPIGFNFTKVQWTKEGHIFGSFSKSDNKDGFFGRATAEGATYIQLTPSFTSIAGKAPTKFPTSVPSFMVKGQEYKNSSIVLCASEYGSSSNMNRIKGYEYFSAAPGWIQIHDAEWYTGTWRVEHMGQDLTGKHSVWLTRNKQLYYNGQTVLSTKGLPGTPLCSSIDNDNYIWVGTDKGMFKSEKSIP